MNFGSRQTTKGAKAEHIYISSDTEKIWMHPPKTTVTLCLTDKVLRTAIRLSPQNLTIRAAGEECDYQ